MTCREEVMKKENFWSCCYSKATKWPFGASPLRHGGRMRDLAERRALAAYISSQLAASQLTKYLCVTYVIPQADCCFREVRTSLVHELFVDFNTFRACKPHAWDSISLVCWGIDVQATQSLDWATLSVPLQFPSAARASICGVREAFVQCCTFFYTRNRDDLCMNNNAHANGLNQQCCSSTK